MGDTAACPSCDSRASPFGLESNSASSTVAGVPQRPSTDAFGMVGIRQHSTLLANVSQGPQDKSRFMVRSRRVGFGAAWPLVDFALCSARGQNTSSEIQAQ